MSHCRIHNPNALKGIAAATRSNNTLAAEALISAWNYATSPSVARTDDEHARCRRLARAIDGRIKRHGIRFGEHDSGARYLP